MAKVLEAEKVEGADKLLKLKVEMGSEIRQMVSGIAKHYHLKKLSGNMLLWLQTLNLLS